MIAKLEGGCHYRYDLSGLILYKINLLCCGFGSVTGRMATLILSTMLCRDKLEHVNAHRND